MTKRLLGGAMIAVWLAGCAPGTRTVVAAPEPGGVVLDEAPALGTLRLTAAGTPVRFACYLDRYPTFEAAALAEIDSTVATSYPGDGTRSPDPAWPPGVPSGWTIEVGPPVFVVRLADGPVSVVGATYLDMHVIRVGTRLDQSSPILLPALDWELGIARRGYEPGSVIASIPPLVTP